MATPKINGLYRHLLTDDFVLVQSVDSDVRDGTQRVSFRNLNNERTFSRLVSDWREGYGNDDFEPDDNQYQLVIEDTSAFIQSCLERCLKVSGRPKPHEGLEKITLEQELRFATSAISSVQHLKDSPVADLRFEGERLGRALEERQKTLLQLLDAKKTLEDKDPYPLGLYKHYQGGFYILQSIDEDTEDPNYPRASYRSLQEARSWSTPICGGWGKPTADGGRQYQPLRIEMTQACEVKFRKSLEIYAECNNPTKVRDVKEHRSLLDEGYALLLYVTTELPRLREHVEDILRYYADTQDRLRAK